MAQKRISRKLNNQIQHYVSLLKSQNLRVDEVYLYGSVAKMSDDAESDVDLCIVSPDFRSWQSALETLWKLRDDATIEARIEPIGLSPEALQDKYAPLAEEIRRTGRRVRIQNAE